MSRIDLLNLEPVTFVRSLKGQKIMFYGDNDLGKTKQAVKFPKPLLLMTESGGNAVNARKIPVTTWDSFIEIVNDLTGRKKPEMQEMYETIIIDTVEELVALNEFAVANEYGVREIGEMNDLKGAPNGYMLSRNRFKIALNKLTLAGYCVVFISHQMFGKELDNKGKEHEIYMPFGSDKQKSSNAYIRNLCDFIFFVKSNGTDDQGDPILSSAYAKKTNFAFARSRYSKIVPFIKEFTAENVTKAILDAIEAEGELEHVSVTENFTEKAESKEQTLKDLIELIKPVYKTLYEIDQTAVNNIVTAQIGSVKISEATENMIPELQSIYNSLMDVALNRNIVIG